MTDYRINNKSSIDRAELSTEHLAGFLKGCKVVDITTTKIRAYIEARQKEGAANGTVNRELAALKRMLNIGAKQTPPSVDRLPFIPMLQENNVRQGFFEYSYFLALRGALPDYLQGFVTFAYRTALSEELSLNK